MIPLAYPPSGVAMVIERMVILYRFRSSFLADLRDPVTTKMIHWTPIGQCKSDKIQDKYKCRLVYPPSYHNTGSWYFIGINLLNLNTYTIISTFFPPSFPRPKKKWKKGAKLVYQKRFGMWSLTKSLTKLFWLSSNGICRMDNSPNVGVKMDIWPFWRGNLTKLSNL